MIRTAHVGAAATAPPPPTPPLAVRAHHLDDLCVVSPAPDVKDKLVEQFDRLRNRASALVGRNLSLAGPDHVGLNDGLIYPGTYYPVGTTAAVAQRAALERAPLSGAVRVAVVLVDFSDKTMAATVASRFQELFFSTGVLAHGSVKEYFADVSGGRIDIQGEVIGPYRMPQTMAAYAGSDNGLQPATPNARTLANDALTAADPHLNLAPYDNDGNGYVDAFIVVHAGRGAEETGAAADIWSHKWVLPSERSVDGTRVYAYLTIPEDAKLGVSAHELGHLLFGWPDLYDTDNTSEGVGNWCLMGSGSWGLGGDRPTHPSAWCKANQGWINVITQTANADITVTDVKTSRSAYRLWKDGAGGNEYFLVENRQQAGYDASLPGQGLLVWHIDEAVANNKNEAHYKVGLLQADGARHLENNTNRGDGGDPFPGTSGNASFTNSSNPSSQSFAGSNTLVSVTGIPASAAAMTVHVTVKQAIAKPVKEVLKDGKEIFKEIVKERPKELKDLKDGRKEFKELKEGRKEFKELKEGRKEFK
ncbi:MAG: M6 family metalloprotease domain-containing protein, partial [Propionicimonas sp.]|nr:M6 family metalloprotease domain-containing protein [Propionicimonas sp.]